MSEREILDRVLKDITLEESEVKKIQKLAETFLSSLEKVGLKANIG
jgi:tRNA nucleotidyltransferase (CCA-adding enzyme)